MVVKYERTKTLFAHAVEQKVIDSEEYAVKQVAKDIEELGFRQVSVKCNQEPRTMALLGRLMRLDQVLHDHPAVGDTQSDGSIENGVKTVMGQLRTMRAALERKLACKIPLDHLVMAWMTTYAVQLLSRFQVGHDGHTPHERLRGKPFKVALPEFGERVWRHLPAAKNVHRDERGKLKVPWEKSSTCGTGTMMLKAKEVRLTTTADRWDKTAIETIARFPWSHHAHAAPPRAILEDQEPPDPSHIQFRKLCHKSETFMSARSTCRDMASRREKCDAIRAVLPSPISHTSRSSARIAEALG